ncbi:glycosyltransferase family 4 protein [Arthrobacter sp. RIT-PI-e]|uniref:glycosyltransferase family 4 protein n=1 Tax=Arthrobacter sp. RIT-PI-e TaxID=1681197 RepID=UPI0006769F75|nr:glycosyltransferase family 4 protein [Arthrobacter sp. RIT-PI-e]
MGAAAFRLEALARGLAEVGAEVSVLTTHPPGPRLPAQPAVKRWPVLRDAGGNVRGYVQYLSFDAPLFFRLLWSRADIVVSEPPPTTGIMVAASSLLRRRGYVYYAADIWTDALAATDAPAPVVGLMKVLEGIALRRARKVVAISDGVAEQTRQFGVDPARVVVVGNGVNTDTFSAEGPTATPGYRYFVYTGTMSEWQGAGVFIDALVLVLQRHPDVRLHFFGQGSAEAALQSRAREVAPGRVLFNGVVPPDEAARWLRGATASLVSIVPGQGYDFAKPTKIYAAASCGIPVIFAGTGDGAQMVIDNDLGSVSNYSAVDIADAMLQVLEAHDTRRATRSSWVEANASLRMAGRRAAAEVVSAVPAGR